ncbi:MAG: S8 family serine peptidase, partial [Promethearchaeota archaeon]
VDDEPKPRRGTALLVTTIIFVAIFLGAVAIPRNGPLPDLRVRVAVVDSGISKDDELLSRVVAEMSFINSSYGYPVADSATEDSRPLSSYHGTYIAKIISQYAADAAIVNAKVVTVNNTATIEGIVHAVRWAVNEQNCSVINLSLGTSPFVGGPLEDVIRWAFDRGVSIVAAAGNGGQSGIPGTSIESPAIYPEVIAVAATDNLGGLFDFSSRGPLPDRSIKPDICATGYYAENGATVFGTSYATAAVSAAVVRIIEFCEENGLSWTPGMIKATLVSTAADISGEEWEVGAGLLDLYNALVLLGNASREDRLPLAAAITPTSGPFEFEQWFVNTTARVSISVFCSNISTFSILYAGNASVWVDGPSDITVNQRGSFEFELTPVANESLKDLDLELILIAPGYRFIRAYFTTDCAAPLAKVAFDTSHSPRAADSIYGQFRTLYTSLTRAGIAVEELRTSHELVSSNLTQYDAIFIIDPCARGYTQVGTETVLTNVFSYSMAEINSYINYWNLGGSILFMGLGNYSLDLVSANELLDPFGFRLEYDQIPSVTVVQNGISSTELVTDIAEHNSTAGVGSFDFNGCSVNYTGSGYSLAQIEVNSLLPNGTSIKENRTLVAAVEGAGGGRMVVSGSNFAFDNWGVGGYYRSDYNALFALQITHWLIGFV